MTQNKKIGTLGVLNFIFSVAYIIAFIAFVTQESPLFDRWAATLSGQLYCSLLVLTALGFIQVIFDFSLLVRQLENIWLTEEDKPTAVLDEEVVPKTKENSSVGIGTTLICLLNLGIPTYLLYGSIIKGAYAWPIVIAFIIALLWILLGAIFFSMARHG